MKQIASTLFMLALLPFIVAGLVFEFAQCGFFIGQRAAVDGFKKLTEWRDRGGAA